MGEKVSFINCVFAKLSFVESTIHIAFSSAKHSSYSNKMCMLKTEILCKIVFCFVTWH